MARTTLNIDTTVLRDLKRLQQVRRTSLGRLVSDLLAEALAPRKSKGDAARPRFQWVAKPMGARVDLSDKDALYAALDGEEPA
jgi:hypothetical protein